MSDKPPAGVPLKRRTFLLGAGGAGALAAAPAVARASADRGMGDTTAKAAVAPEPAAPPAKGATASPPPAAYRFFNSSEAAFIEAMVDTLIPVDQVGPGALELGVAIYIDGQLGGAFGQGARRYMQGPFAEGTPQQGWQIAMTPAEVVRAGIADVDALAQAGRKAAFADLATADRAVLLGDIETGKAELATVPSRLFFSLMLNLTCEGYFGDPIHGGNRGQASWKMIGFPGVAGMYAEDITTYRNRPYPASPKSIQDFL